MMVFAVSILLVSLALLGRVVGRNWLAPVAFAPLVWAGLVVSAAVLQAALPLRQEGLWVILSMVVAFQVGALVVHHAAPSSLTRSGEAAPGGGPEDAVVRRLAWTTAAFAALSTAGVLLVLRTSAATVGIDLSLGGLLRLGNLVAVMRYTGVGDLPGVVRALVYWTFAAALLGGMLAAVARTFPQRVLSVFPLFPALIAGVAAATRSGILIAVVMWLGGFWALQVSVSAGAYRIFRMKWILRVTLGVVSLVGLSAVLLWLRAGVWRALILQTLILTTVVDFFGSISAFTTWFAGAQPLPLALGAYTFAGPFDVAGLAPRLQGLYANVVTFPSGLASNIYTVFRGLIQDFGLGGAWAACLAVGALSTIAYKQCAAGRMRWVVPLSFAYAQITFCHLYSLFTHNSVAMGWVVAAVVWLWPARIWSAAGPQGVPLPRAQGLA